MSIAWDPSVICCDENCERTDLHRKHLVAKRPPSEPHHRPKKSDPKTLTGAVARAVSRTPKVFREIVRDVVDDYGKVSPTEASAERSIHRHLKKLVERGQIIKLDLGFTFAVYLRPKSRWLRDPEAIREYIEGEIEYGRECTSDVRYASVGELVPT